MRAGKIDNSIGYFALSVIALMTAAAIVYGLLSTWG